LDEAVCGGDSYCGSHHDHRDIVIETLADSEAELIDRVGSLMVERDSYRALSQAAIHQLYALTAEVNRLRASHHRLIDECQRGRTQTARRAESA
jgi:hypothetical protein